MAEERFSSMVILCSSWNAFTCVVVLEWCHSGATEVLQWCAHTHTHTLTHTHTHTPVPRQRRVLCGLRRPL
jgi:hypothetical protein